MQAHEEQQARTSTAKNREAGASTAPSQSAYNAARTPGMPGAAAALQHSVGNQAFVVARRMAPPEAHAHSAGCGHGGGMHSQTGELADPQEQTEALAAAQASPGQKLSGPKLTDDQSYFQNPAMSQVSIHTGSVVQRALAAFRARSMTVGTKIFLGHGEDEEHEKSHANEYLKGIRTTGKDAGAGIPVTEKHQDSEKSAELDSSARRAGAKIAPSELRRMPAAQRAALDQEQ